MNLEFWGKNLNYCWNSTGPLCDEILKNLQQLSLVKSEGDDKFILVHPLIYRYVKDKMELSEAKTLAIIANYYNYLRDSATNKQKWPEIDQQLPHIISINRLAIKNKKPHLVVGMVDLLHDGLKGGSSYGYYLPDTHKYNQALELLTLRLEATKLLAQDQSQDKYHEQDIAYSYFLIAQLYYKFYYYDQALEHYQLALNIYKEKLGDDCLGVGNTLNYIGNIYFYEKKYDQAMSYYQEALRIRKLRLGNDHQDVADTINNIAITYDGQEKLDQGMEQHKEALRIRKLRLGNDHPDVAMTLFNMAFTYRNQKKYDQALSHNQEALRIQKAMLGDDHPHIAQTLSGIASIYRNQGEYNQAMPYCQEALRIHKARLGDNHPYVAMALFDIAFICRGQNKYDQALSYYQEALGIQKARLGDDHPHVATTLSSIGTMYYNQNKYDQAMPYYQQALEIYKRKRINDGRIIDVIYNIALIYDNQNKYDQALPCYRETLRMSKEKFGENHPSTVRAINNLTILQKKLPKPSNSTTPQETQQLENSGCSIS